MSSLQKIACLLLWILLFQNTFAETISRPMFYYELKLKDSQKAYKLWFANYPQEDACGNGWAVDILYDLSWVAIDTTGLNESVKDKLKMSAEFIRALDEYRKWKTSDAGLRVTKILLGFVIKNPETLKKVLGNDKFVKSIIAELNKNKKSSDKVFDIVWTVSTAGIKKAIEQSWFDKYEASAIGLEVTKWLSDFIPAENAQARIIKGSLQWLLVSGSWLMKCLGEQNVINTTGSDNKDANIRAIQLIGAMRARDYILASKQIASKSHGNDFKWAISDFTTGQIMFCRKQTIYLSDPTFQDYPSRMSNIWRNITTFYNDNDKKKIANQNTWKDSLKSVCLESWWKSDFVVDADKTANNYIRQYLLSGLKVNTSEYQMYYQAFLNIGKK